MELHHQQDRSIFILSSESLGRSFSTELVATKHQIERGIKADHRPGLFTIVEKFVDHLVFRELRTELNPEERAVIGRIAKIEQEVVSLFPRDNLSRRSSVSLMRDIFDSLLESSRGGNVQPLVIGATTCPDYAFDPQTNRYLSDGGLSCGPGLCGSTILAQLLPLAKVLSAHQVRFRIDFMFADIEANDSDMLAKSGLTREEFLSRVESSKKAMSEVATSTFQSEGIQGEISSSSMSSSLEFLRPRTLPDEVLGKALSGITRMRQPFYERFFKESLSLAPDKQEFFLRRARKDFDDHFDLGNALIDRRASGERFVLATLSNPALVRYFNFQRESHLPVIRLNQSY